jgi:3-isopropylmalate dehydrogenase
MSSLKNIAVLPGDGIGPEVITQTIKVLEAISERFGVEFNFKFGSIGRDAIQRFGNPLPKSTLNLCLKSDAVLLGAIGDSNDALNVDDTLRPETGMLRLRKELGLYVNKRPIKVYENLAGRSVIRPELLKNVDFVIYRELSSGIYYGEKINQGDFASDNCTYNRQEIERIAKLAFKEASNRKNKLTVVDKANVLETSRLWRTVVMQVAKSFPEVKVDFIFIDNAAVQIILDPARFDVVLCSNLFGDILSDEASVLVGSLGLLPSGSRGDKYSLYEPVHGSFPEAAGKDIANPIATILSAEMMLRDAGMAEEADTILRAVNFCMEKSILTEDLNPDISYSCSQMGDIIYTLILDGPEALKTKSLREANSTIV